MLMIQILPNNIGRANIKPIISSKICFHFFILLSTHAQSYQQHLGAYTPFLEGYPQFKKVFRFLAEEIHTCCEQRIVCKYFVK
jgi:hypothetical protein